MFGAYSFGTPQFAEGDREQQYALVLSAGTYAVSGSDAQLLASRVLSLLAGSYAISGADAALQLLISSLFRVHLIRFDQRTVVVPRDNRTVVVPYEQRTIVVPAENL